MVKTLLLAALTFLIGLFTAGCGPDTNPYSQRQTESPDRIHDKPVKLRISWWGSRERHDATLKILALYTKKNPNVTFEPEYSAFDGYADKLATQAAAKNAADIIQMDASWLADWNARGYLANLTGIRTEDIESGLLESGQYNGKQTAVPLGKNAWGMIYDKDTLEKLGFEMPNNGITWDQFFKLAREIKAKLDEHHYVLADFTNNREMYTSYQLSKGYDYPVSLDGKFNFDRDTWLEWVRTFEDLRKEGVVPPVDIAVGDKDMDLKQDLLVTGKIIFKAAHAAQASSWDSLKPGSIGVYSIPMDKKGGGWLKATFFFSVSQDSLNKVEAMKFIDWFINDPEAGALSGTTRGVPISGKIVSRLQAKLTAADQLTIEMIDKVSVGAQPFNPGAKGWINFDTKEYKSIAESVMFGKLTPEQAFEELKMKAEAYQK
ncbi:MAG: transporter substrate-binding protein [Paenibacillus sp.]|jgi:ABC-type glycerol-3-phosphate transport system substrate-binding protein|nr:transporter substrate-binding protein [Paenibacillus sp.]